MSLLMKQILHRTKCFNDTTALYYVSSRNLSIIPSLYDGENPGPKFFSPNVQVLLKRLTRPDFAKVFRKKPSGNFPVLRAPKYKFLTDEELKAEIAKAHAKADRLLQMPPVVKIQQPIDRVLSKDPALTGYDTAKYVFTDITFGISNEHRLITERDVDGTLKYCDHTTRKRLNQAYFPIVGRKIREPIMFSDEDRFNSLLDRHEYEFVLDRACRQYEPDEPSYQKVTSITYQHVDLKHNYHILRSTRHFGPLVFYLTWHQMVDGLMLELLQTGAIRDAACLIATRHAIHGDIADGGILDGIINEIMSTPLLQTKPEQLTEEDIALDTKCVECVEKYVANNSAMRSQQELALQGFRETYQQLVELSRGLKKAHGSV